MLPLRGLAVNKGKREPCAQEKQASIWAGGRAGTVWAPPWPLITSSSMQAAGFGLGTPLPEGIPAVLSLCVCRTSPQPTDGRDGSINTPAPLFFGWCDSEAGPSVAPGASQWDRGLVAHRGRPHNTSVLAPVHALLHPLLPG